MIEVHPGLFVGKQEDLLSLPIEHVPGDFVQFPGWAVVHAAKEPTHREFVGYVAKGAPKGDEYLFARRGWRLALNLIDVAFPEYVKPELVDKAMDFIHDARCHRLKVLIHCNQGGSRAPALALHWLRRNSPICAGPANDFETAEATMRRIYPAYKPAEGVRGFVKEHWDDEI